MARQGIDLQLTRYDNRGWRATFYTTGMEHSPASATGTAWERTPWHAPQRAAWEALERGWLSRPRNPGMSLVLPEGEAVLVQMNRSPIIRANQAHPVSGRDREAATIAGLPEAGSVPQLNRAITRKAALFNPVSDELSSDIWSHAPSGLHIVRSDQSALRYSEARLTAYGRGPM
jgi:hypothetical protein